MFILSCFVSDQADIRIRTSVQTLFTLLPLLSVVAPCIAFAQVADTSRVNGETNVDHILDIEDTDAVRGERASEYMEDLRARPICINTARVSTLATIPSVSVLDARRIVAHRARHGEFAQIRDLLRVEGLSVDDYRRLRPFITIRTTPHGSEQSGRSGSGTRPEDASWEEDLRDPHLRVSYRWGRQIDLGRGYSPDPSGGSSRYASDPVRHVLRAQAHFGDRLELAGAMDKDPGEMWRWQLDEKQPGFDHIAGSIAVNRVGPVKTAILGDYTVSSGHGIGLWRGMAFGKGRDPTSGVIRSGRGLSPFASTEENRFFRGGALSVDVQRLLETVLPSMNRRIEATAYGFVSQRRLDAGIDIQPESGLPLVSSLRAGGLHRTKTERDSRDAVREYTIGGGLDVEMPIGLLHTSLGGAAFSARLDHPFTPPDRPDEAFDRRGSSMNAGSAYLSAQWRSLLITGEVAGITDRATIPGRVVSSRPRWAGVAALAYDDGRRVDAVLHVRQFGRGYDNPYVAAFSETAAQNEHGLYGGLRIKVLPQLHVAGYLDQYAFRWLRYNLSRPTTGRDTRLVIEHKPRPWIDQTIQIRSETKQQSGSSIWENQNTPRSPVQAEPVVRETRQSIRWSADVEVSDRFNTSTRVEGIRVWAEDEAGPTQYGWLLAQDVEWNIHSRLDLIGRISAFETDGFAARVFAYERDVQYAFRVPALFGRGERSYILVRLDLGRRATLEAKYGVTRYSDRTVIGSGLNELQSNRRREIRMQIRWRF